MKGHVRVGLWAAAVVQHTSLGGDMAGVTVATEVSHIYMYRNMPFLKFITCIFTRICLLVCKIWPKVGLFDIRTKMYMKSDLKKSHFRPKS